MKLPDINSKNPLERADAEWLEKMRQAKAGNGTEIWYPILETIAKENGLSGLFDIEEEMIQVLEDGPFAKEINLAKKCEELEQELYNQSFELLSNGSNEEIASNLAYRYAWNKIERICNMVYNENDLLEDIEDILILRHEHLESDEDNEFYRTWLSAEAKLKKQHSDWMESHGLKDGLSEKTKELFKDIVEAEKAHNQMLDDLENPPK